MITTSCDICGKKFSQRDDYVHARVDLPYTEYQGDNGSQRLQESHDACEKCHIAVSDFVYDLKMKKRRRRNDKS